MKYVIVQDPNTGYVYPIVFPEPVIHKLAAAVVVSSLGITGDVQVRMSAGFCSFNTEKQEWVVDVTRKSDSLKVGPNEADASILQAFLERGLAGLDLQNYITYLGLVAKGVAPPEPTVKRHPTPDATEPYPHDDNDGA
jgi:hypothetical protein